MDRSMKDRAVWQALLARIQSPSKELEATLAKSNSNLIEALSGLDELERLTQKHLAPPEPILPPSPMHATTGAPMSSTPARTSAPLPQPDPVKYQTSHEEYAPALNQSALVEALLQYQRKKSLRSPKPAAKPNAAGATGARSTEASNPAFAKSDFAPMRIPAIEAEPKTSPLGRSAAPSVRLPVLRLKAENSSGGSSGNSDDH